MIRDGILRYKTRTCVSGNQQLKQEIMTQAYQSPSSNTRIVPKCTEILVKHFGGEG